MSDEQITETSAPQEGTVATPSVPDTHAILLNTKTVTFAGTGGANATLSQIVDQINAVSGHNVVAASFATPNIINSDPSSSIYGLVGGYTPFSAAIDSGSGNTTCLLYTSDAADE